MAKALFALVLGAVCLLAAGSASADTMKWSQPPDLSPNGMDVSASISDPTGLPFLLASDFLCTQTGPITEIHVFGSWLNDLLPQGNPAAVTFQLSIHADIPDPDGTGPGYSMPGPAMWLREFNYGTFEVRIHAEGILEGWYSPPQMYLPLGDHVCYEYIFRLNPGEFIQQGTTSNPIVYWLDVQASPMQQGTFFGWKTAVPPHLIDDAVFVNGMDGIGLILPWQELRYPDMHPLHPQSFDLAFQIWGPEPTGACCYPNGTCAVVTRPACVGGGGTYLGDATVCLGDVNPLNGVDDACESVVPTGACCFDDGTCRLLMAAACTAAGGSYAGNGTTCLGDVNGNGVDDACEGTVVMAACCYGDPLMPICVNTTSTVCGQHFHGTWHSGQSCATYQCPVAVIGACCYMDGSCAVVTQAACTTAQGTYMGDGTTCVDANANGTADICESLEHRKWMQVPDMSPMGMDVHATNNVVLADDFQCTETGPITKVVVYGSWFQDMLPNHTQVSFVLSFHKDIPASGQDFSKPGALICTKLFLPGQYQFEPIALPGQVEEGWYDPTQQMYVFPGDHNIFKYTFVIEDPCWRQTGTETSPKVYWLDVQMQTSVGGHPLWGWKTTPQHWNDDATWAMGTEPSILTPWAEMRYPPQHPMTPASVDLAFEIWGQAEPTGACCFEDGSCRVMTAIDCGQASGTYGGDNSHCAGTDVNQNGVDDFCDGIVTLGACCYGDPLMPICVNTTATICGQQFHGTWHSGKTCATYQCPVSCCVGRVGDANGLGVYPNEVTISDIQLLVFAKFISALPCEQNLHCLTEADVNQSGGVNPKCSDVTISDIQTVVNHLFICGPPNCPLKLCF